MKSWITLLLLLAATTHTYAELENTTCKSCHQLYLKSIRNLHTAKHLSIMMLYIKLYGTNTPQKLREITNVLNATHLQIMMS